MISGTSLLLYHYKLFYSDSPLTSMLLFNSLDTLQTKPLPPIRHICDFSRGVLNVCSIRSHPTLAPRPQICLIGGNGFCAVAGEDELNRGGDLGTEANIFYLLENDWEQGDDLAF